MGSVNDERSTVRFGSRKVIAGLVAVVALGVSAGVGIAATTGGGSDPEVQHQAIIEDAAKRLGVEPQALEEALRGAHQDAALAHVDELEAAGRITPEQADELRQRIESGEGPLRHHVEHHGGGPIHGAIETTSEFLGLEPAEILEALQDGASLAELAEQNDKTAAGLVDAILADAEERLDEAVAAERLTQDEADKLLAALRETVEVMVAHPGPLVGPHGVGPDGGMHHDGVPDGPPADTPAGEGASA